MKAVETPSSEAVQGGVRHKPPSRPGRHPPALTGSIVALRWLRCERSGLTARFGHDTKQTYPQSLLCEYTERLWPSPRRRRGGRRKHPPPLTPARVSTGHGPCCCRTRCSGANCGSQPAAAIHRRPSVQQPAGPTDPAAAGCCDCAQAGAKPALAVQMSWDSRAASCSQQSLELLPSPLGQKRRTAAPAHFISLLFLIELLDKSMVIYLLSPFAFSAATFRQCKVQSVAIPHS